MTRAHRHILLLRGINVGAHKRIPMPVLREVLSGAGFEEVQTYVQSGNAVVSSSLAPEELRDAAEDLIAAQFGFDVDVVVRTRDELAEVVRADPLGSVAVDPKRYLVTFLATPLHPSVAERLMSLAAPPEQLVVRELELYSWHPAGVGRSALWSRTSSKDLGVVATSRNWTTVKTLLEIAG